MKILIANYSGFCKGVKDVVDILEKNASTDTLTYGPVVHNDSVINYFKNKGIEYLEPRDAQKLQEVKDKTVVIRAHGVTPEIVSLLEKENKILDGTCPFVSKVQKIAKNIVEENKELIILGEKNHPEIIGINGWAHNKGIIIKDIDELIGYKLKTPMGVVAQTTFKVEKYNDIINYLKDKYSEGNVDAYNTICIATKQRQQAVKDMAREADMVLVIGGKDSSNTAKLTSICKEMGVVTYQIEEAHQIDPSWFKNIKTLGVTAGASTPDWIIREVISMVNEVSNQEFNEESHDEIKAWETIEQAYEQNQVLTGKVVEVVKGGVLIDLGIRAFMPASLLDTKFVEDLSQFLDQELSFHVKEFDKEKNKVILSRKDLIMQEQKQAQTEALNNLKEGQKVKGIVRRMADFGAFVDLGGIDGLIHVSNLSWQRVSNPKEVLEIGQEVEVVVLKIDDEKQKISLSLKAAQENPFEAKAKDLKAGDIVTGKIVRLADFGAFVEIAPQVDGLVHISQISDEHITRPADVLSVGQEVSVKILEVDLGSKRISLSIKEAKPKEDFTQYEQSDNLNVTLGDRFGDLFKKQN